MGSVGSSAKAPPPTHGTCGSTVTVVEVIPPLVRKSSVSYPSVCCESAVRQELPKMAHEHARSERRLSRRSINHRTDPSAIQNMYRREHTWNNGGPGPRPFLNS